MPIPGYRPTVVENSFIKSPTTVLTLVTAPSYMSFQYMSNQIRELIQVISHILAVLCSLRFIVLCAWFGRLAHELNSIFSLLQNFVGSQLYIRIDFLLYNQSSLENLTRSLEKELLDMFETQYNSWTCLIGSNSLSEPVFEIQVTRCGSSIGYFCGELHL